jgi:hypothetical protein
MENIKKIMNLLINDSEIIYFLQSLINYEDFVKSIPFENPEEVIVIGWFQEQNSGKKPFNAEKHGHKFKEKIRRAVTRDLRNHLKKIKSKLDTRKLFYHNIIKSHFNTILQTIGEDVVIQQYKNNKKQNFVKTFGYSLDKDAELIRRESFTDYKADCVVRSTFSNDKMLIEKINHNYPFWFIDAGYTNFIENNKKWHRIVRNHLHFGNTLKDLPVDRLGNFTTFPAQWRSGGEKILIIEPGPFSAGIFGVNVAEWKKIVEEEVRKYSDKPIIFREKFNKKIRTSLYKHLCDEDYYCVININSNAATESIWAGIPVITLDKHITNSVSRNQISDINNLSRPNLANWLCMLSYSQFTYDEIVSGSALEIINTYYV